MSGFSGSFSAPFLLLFLGSMASLVALVRVVLAGGAVDRVVVDFLPFFRTLALSCEQDQFSSVPWFV